MSLSKILPALALAMALSPVAAHARSCFNTPKAQYYLAPIAGEQATQANQGVRVSQATQSAFSNLTVVKTGINAKSFPNSFGG
jgi:hypothetical protein